MTRYHAPLYPPLRWSDSSISVIHYLYYFVTESIVFALAETFHRHNGENVSILKFVKFNYLTRIVYLRNSSTSTNTESLEYVRVVKIRYASRTHNQFIKNRTSSAFISSRFVSKYGLTLQEKSVKNAILYENLQHK